MNRWSKIGTGIAIAVVVVLAVGFWARTGVTDFFYPVAPPMPAMVNESMPEILARLESILKTNAPQVLAGLQPGLSSADISKLEQQYHVQMPEEIEALYRWHDGAHLTTNYVGDDFIPGHRFLPLEESLEEKATEPKGAASPLQRIAYQLLAGHRDAWICLFSDGAEGGYWFDPGRQPAEGAVFWTFGEERAYVFFPSAKNLMAGIAKFYDVGIYRLKPGSSPPQLEEDFEQSGKMWNEFGATCF